MALAYTVLTQSSSTTNATSYTTASFTPSPNSLLLLIVGYTGSGTQPLPVVTSSADGATWDDLETAGAARSISIFRRSTTSSPPSVQATITHPTAATYTSCLWAVVEITGADMSGNNNGLSAIAQQNVGNGTGTSSSVSLDAAATSGNATIYAQIHPTNENVTAGSGWTEIMEQQQTNPTSTVFGEISLTATDPATASWTTSGAWRGIIVEIKAAASGGTGATVNAVTATATATASPAPAVSAGAVVAAVTATATSLATSPVATGGATVTAVAATASATALAPVIDSGPTPNGNVSAVAAEATASALPPVATGGAVAASVAATSTALALPPTVTGSGASAGATVEATVVQATAAVLAPVLSASATVLPLRARAIAAAQFPPVVTGQQNATVEVPRIYMQGRAHRPKVDVINPTYRFECPTHEAPMRSPERIHQFYRITHAASVVRVNGSFTTIHQPRPDQVRAAGEEGVDYFLGGRVYQVSLATRTELLAAGFDVE